MNPKDIPLPNQRGWMILDALRDEMRQDLSNGEMVTCLCCGGRSKVYSRTITGTMVEVLRLLDKAQYGLTNGQIIAATKQSGGGNVSLMLHWELVDSCRGSVWTITDRGRRFLCGEIAIPKRVLLYNNICLGFDDTEQVRAHDLVDHDFSLEDVLSPGHVRAVEEPAV